MLLNIIFLIGALTLHLFFEVLGYFTFTRRYEPGISMRGRMLMALIVLTLTGGFFGGFIWWFDFPGSFAWDVPPLASRMLASAGWSFAFLSLAVLLSPSPRRLRLYLWCLGVYMWPLTLAILFLHLDRLDFRQPITYAFLSVVALLDILAVVFLFRQPQVKPVSQAETEPARFMVKGWLGLVVLVTAAWSLALFITDQGPIPAIWAWRGDALSSRLIGAMLLTLAVGAAYALPLRETTRLMLGVTAIYGFGLSFASLWNLLVGKPVNLIYLLVFGFLATASTTVWLIDLALGFARNANQPVQEGLPEGA